MTLDATPGPRDQLVTPRVEAALRELGDGAATLETLANADASERLSARSPRRAPGLAELASRARPSMQPMPTSRPRRSSKPMAANALIDDDAAQIVLPPTRAARDPRAGADWRVAAAGAPPGPSAGPQRSAGERERPTEHRQRAAGLSWRRRGDVDLICAFVIMSGVTRLEEQLRALVSRGGRLRVITTTYMARPSARPSTGSSSRRAVRGRARRPKHEAPRQGVAAGAPSGHDDGVHRLVEPLAHRAVRRPYGLEWNVRLAQATPGT